MPYKATLRAFVTQVKKLLRVLGVAAIAFYLVSVAFFLLSTWWRSTDNIFDSPVASISLGDLIYGIFVRVAVCLISFGGISGGIAIAGKLAR